MKIEKENVLSLIGSKRYHSCILTSYSFDFYFFEMQVMRYLRSANVRNVNVYIDGHYYSELLNQSSGAEMQISAGYSLYPYFHSSVFHPKVWMFFGHKEGLLIIGSGNLTYSGNGNNDEIWGAFHYDLKNTQHGAIFSSAWNYMCYLTKDSKGIIHEKTNNWIINDTPWLQDLPVADDNSFVRISKNKEVKLLYNSKKSTIWQGLTKLLNNEKVTEVVAISPFYDTSGITLSHIYEQFRPSVIKVIIEESGQLPVKMKDDKHFSFHDWSETGFSEPSKLHAKILFLKTKKNINYCLLGSANITSAGLGLVNGKRVNHEISILMRVYDLDLSELLGIKLSDSYQLSDFVGNKNESYYDTILENNKFPVQLTVAEIFGKELTIYIKGSWESKLSITFFNHDGQIIDSIKIKSIEESITVHLTDALLESRYIQLFDKQTKISNRIIISDFVTISKTNPRTHNSEFDTLIDVVTNGELERVLDLLQFAINDDMEPQDPINYSTGKSVYSEKKNKPTDKSRETYDLTSYKLDDKSLSKQLLISSQSLRILDCLKFIRYSNHLLQAGDLQVFDPDLDLSKDEGNEENEVPTEKIPGLQEMNNDRAKLTRFLSKLYDNIHNRTGTNKKITVTLTDLARYMIALELLLEYGGKNTVYPEGSELKTFGYLPFGNQDYENNSVKGCVLNIVGDFLMLGKNGFRTYEPDYTNVKVNEMKKEALIKTILCITNCNWSNNESHYFKTLLLNTLHIFSEKEHEIFDSKFISELTHGTLIIKFHSFYLNENLYTFINEILPAYKNSIIRLRSKIFDVKALKGQIIYKSPFGFCHVNRCKLPNEYCLSRPGFNWDDDEQDYIRHTDDDVYNPIKLSSFISVEV